MAKDLKALIEGHHRFRSNEGGDYTSLMEELAKGQAPQTMVISCCDSRADPAILLQAEPGDIFMVRNIANIVPPYELDSLHHGTSVALEFGVCYLGIKELVIIGHSSCGGIQAAIEGVNPDHDDFISSWVADVPTKGSSVDEVAKQSLLKSYQHCLQFPFIKERLDADQLHIHLWFLEIQEAKLLAYDFDTKTFSPL